MASNTVASKSMEPVLDFAAVSTLSLYKGIWRALYIFITCREKWRGQDPDLISHVHVHVHVHARVRVPKNIITASDARTRVHKLLLKVSSVRAGVETPGGWGEGPWQRLSLFIRR